MSTDGDGRTLSPEYMARLRAHIRAINPELRYRYFETAGGWMYGWTTERDGDGRWLSFCYQPTGRGSQSGRKHVRSWRLTRELSHPTRRAAKARALRMYQARTAQEQQRSSAASLSR